MQNLYAALSGDVDPPQPGGHHTVFELVNQSVIWETRINNIAKNDPVEYTVSNHLSVVKFMLSIIEIIGQLDQRTKDTALPADVREWAFGRMEWLSAWFKVEIQNFVFNPPDTDSSYIVGIEDEDVNFQIDGRKYVQNNFGPIVDARLARMALARGLVYLQEALEEAETA